MDAMARILLLLAAVAGLGNALGTGTFTVLYSPKYVKFLESASAIETSDVPGVVAASLGLPLKEDLKWNGLAEGDLFRRPKASVVITIMDAAANPLKIEHYQQTYLTLETDGSLDTDAIINNIEKENWKQDPLSVDFYVESTVLTMRSRSADVFNHLPSTLYGLRDNFVSDWFTAERLGSLNISQDADLQLVGELYAIAKIVDLLKQHEKLLLAKAPDFFHFAVSGLRSLDESYGSQSAQVNDAHRLVSAFLDQIAGDFRALYSGNVVVQALSYTPHSAALPVRKTRSLLEAPGANVTDLNLAPVFTYMYAPIFNIILWVMIGLAIAVFGISWGIWHMDPGRDSLIYRMTSQRMKRE